MPRLSGAIVALFLTVSLTLLARNEAAPHQADLVDIDTPAFLVVDDLMVLERDERAVGSGSGSGSGSGLGIGSGFGSPVEADNDVVETDPVAKNPHRVRIRSLRVTSSVTARFTKTVVTSNAVNPANQSQEVNFRMELPKEAFISGFLIETEGQVFHSRVDEKQKAQRAYDQARERGQTAGQVKQTSEKKNFFTISINIAANSTLSFNLTYEELLKREDGYFENSISISPGQAVDHLVVLVHVSEPQGIDEEKLDFFVRRPDSSGGDGEVLRPLWAETKQLHRTRASVQFHPKPEEQRHLSATGNLGKFVVRYDVIHEQDAGAIQIVNGYFVHHFSPNGFKPTKKNVVFVLDTSGSMGGTKIHQMKQAMETILSDLREQDQFSIVTFSTRTDVWRRSLVPATANYVEMAKRKVRRMGAGGGTNLHGGIEDAITILNNIDTNTVSTVGTYSLIIMLTDGIPTSGRLTTPEDIKTDLSRKIGGRFSLFCLGFGNDVNYPFLEQLSLQNRGLARKIYLDSDAALQLVGFFDEVATPLLVNVQINYEDNMVVTNSISQSIFPSYFEGTELVVAGQLSPEENLPDVLVCVVTAETQDVQIRLEMEVNVTKESDAMLSPHAVDDFAQRLWAFMTIKELLRRRVAADGRDEKEALKQRALDLSLKYHFVTPLTSLVVVKPDDEHLADEVEPDVTDDTPEGQGPPQSQPGPMGSPGPVGPVGPGPRYHYGPQSKSGGPPGPPGHGYSQAPPYGKSPGSPSGGSMSVDSDPHFLIHAPQGNITICFNVMGQPGDVFRLIEDPLLGIYVDGHVASVHLQDQEAGSSTQAPTIFNRITLTFPGCERVVVTTTEVFTQPWLPMPWSRNNWDVGVSGQRPLLFSVREGKYLYIRYFDADISLVIMRHDIQSHHVDKSDYLGLYVEDGEGFSPMVNGLIGQFQRKKIHLKRNSISVEKDNRVIGYIRVNKRRVRVMQSERRNLLTDTVERCWYVPNHANGVIDGTYRSYLVGS